MHWQIQEFEKGGHIASAERGDRAYQPMMGVWGLLSPSGVHQGLFAPAWLGGEGAKPSDVKPRGSASSRGSLKALFSSLGLGTYCLVNKSRL